MVSKVDKISMERLIMQVGFPYNIKELRSAYKYNVDVNLAMEFETKIVKAKNFNEVRQLILQYESIFDKGVYVLHLGRMAEKDLDNQKIHNILTGHEGEEEKKLAKLPKNQVIIVNPKSNLRRCVVTAKELLKTESVADIGVNSSTGEISIYTSKEFAEEKYSLKRKISKSEKRIEQIDEKIGLTEILKYLSPRDLIDICEYPNLGNILAVRLFKEQKVSEEKKQEDDKNGILETAKECDYNAFESTVRKYCAYIDIDKLLLLANAIFNNKHGNSFELFTAEEAGNLQDFTEKVGELIDAKKTTMSSPRFISEISFKAISEFVESLNKHFINGKYFEYDEINKMVEDITNGFLPITNISKREYINTFRLTSKKLLTLDKNNPEAIQYLIDNEMLQPVEIEKLLENKRKFTNEQTLYYINKGLISEEKLFELYNESKVSVENLEYVKFNVEDKDFSKLLSAEKLVELYLDSEKTEEFEKYRKLYKLFVIDETKKEKDERESKKDSAKAIKDLERKILTRRKAIGINILDKSEKLLEDESIYDLYRKGLLFIDTVIDYVGYDSVSKLFTLGELKPRDVKKLMSDKILTESMLEETFKNEELTENQKLILVYSSFPLNDEKDAEMRNKFIGCMPNEIKTFNQSVENTEGTPIEEIVTESQIKNVSEPWSKWNLISTLDKDYSQEYLKDGNIIFYLPNRSKYIIEKIYDKNNGPAYGSAIYILDEKVFETNSNEILVDGCINRASLASLNKTQMRGVKKLVHTGWESALVRYFDIEKN